VKEKVIAHTKAIDVVVRKNGSPMMYPMLKDPLCRGIPVPTLFMVVEYS